MVREHGAAWGRCPERSSKPLAARLARWGGSIPSPFRICPDGGGLTPTQLHTIVTAGHVDHGKTALVRALTGVDTDRLPEEKLRGLTIALGFAPLELGSGRIASIVDVPGHHRFVRTMVSGATGVSGFLMTVAADDGVMPQTVEHFQVLASLGIDRGVVAITKSDAADPKEAIAEVNELMPGFPALACSSKSGEGISALREALDRLLRGEHESQSADLPAILHLDRVFVMHGAGTVVTGTLRSGSIRVGDILELLPANESVRVRQLHVHNRPQQLAVAGQRVAVNLAGVRRRRVEVGDVLASAGHVRETQILDCSIRVTELSNRDQVHVHHGTRHSSARAYELDDDLWQLRLDRPLLAADGDRVLLRVLNPPRVVGGGEIVDSSARRHGANEAAVARLRRRIVLGNEEPDEPPDAHVSSASASPLADLPADAERIGLLARSAGIELLSVAQLGCSPKELAALQKTGILVRVSRGLVSHEAVCARVERAMVELIEREGEASIGSFKRTLGVSRRVALAWMNHCDSNGITLRLQDDSRVLKRSGVTKR